MKVIVLFVAAVVSFSIFGCGNNAKSDSSADAPISKGDQKTQQVSDPNAIKARELLKASLDSWVFGDSKEAWQKSYRNVDIADERISTRPFGLNLALTRPPGSYPSIKLLKYEIGISRETTIKANKEIDWVGYEFMVTLHAQDIRGNDVKRKHNYMVDRLNGKWTIRNRPPKD